MDIHIHTGGQLPLPLSVVLERGNIAMPADRQLTPKDREEKILERLGIYAILPRGLFGYFLIGNGQEIETALKSLMKQGKVKSRVERTGRDIVEVYYRADRAQLVEAFLDLNQ